MHRDTHWGRRIGLMCRGRAKEGIALNDETAGTGAPQSGQSPPPQETPPPGPGAGPQEPRPEPTPQHEIEQGKVPAIVGYVSLLCGLPLFIVPLVTPPGNKFAKSHGKQSMVLYITAIVIGVVLGFVLAIPLHLIPFVGTAIWGLLMAVLGIVFLVAAILGIVKAANGERWIAPVVGEFAENLKI